MENNSGESKMQMQMSGVQNENHTTMSSIREGYLSLCCGSNGKGKQRKATKKGGKEASLV